MNRNFRRFLFYLSVAIFLVVGAVLVIFAQGYKFDFLTWELVKTGSLQLKVNVSADIYINDKLQGKTSFFGNAFTGNRLLPRSYVIRVEKEGYQTWSKNADIKAGLVTDYPRVFLIPRKINEEFVASSSFQTFDSASFDTNSNSLVIISGSKTEIILLENGESAISTPTPAPSISSSPTPTPFLSPTPTSPMILAGAKSAKSPDGAKNIWFDDHEIWIEWLRDSGYQPFMKAGEYEVVARYPNQITDVQWYRDSAHLFIESGGVLSFIETDTRGGTNSYGISSINSPFYYSLADDVVYKFENGILTRIDIR